MRITDLMCAILAENPLVRIVTDAGLDGYGQIESTKPHAVPPVLSFRDAILGEDPTNVERVMLKIRQRGSFERWASAIGAIETADRVGSRWIAVLASSRTTHSASRSWILS